MKSLTKQKSKSAAGRPAVTPALDSHHKAESRSAHQDVGRKAGSKTDQVLALLSREGGASIVDLTATTGWLPHTTRAALTGLRKRGHKIEAERKEDGPTVYRLIAPTAAKPKRRLSTAKAKA